MSVKVDERNSEVDLLNAKILTLEDTNRCAEGKALKFEKEMKEKIDNLNEIIKAEVETR